MTITLHLPKKLEKELAAKAAQSGLSLSQYVLGVLSGEGGLEVIPKTGNELVEYWQSEGLIGMRSNITDSQRHARKIRSRAERRLRE